MKIGSICEDGRREQEGTKFPRFGEEMLPFFGKTSRLSDHRSSTGRPGDLPICDLILLNRYIAWPASNTVMSPSHLLSRNNYCIIAEMAQKRLPLVVTQPWNYFFGHLCNIVEGRNV